MDVAEERNLVINLICPSVSLSKVVQFMAMENQRIDLGLISKTFGLDPLTIKINGHFISRGLDFIAFSVTWKSLISFFSARGLSTGISASEPLRVDGKLCKVGTKRVYDTAGAENMIYGISEGGNKQTLYKDINVFKKSKFMGSAYTAEEDTFTKCEGAYMKKEHKIDQRKSKMCEFNPEIHASLKSAVEDKNDSKCDESGLKRKNQLDSVQPQKKIRMHETNIGLRKNEKASSAIEYAIAMQL